MADIDTRALRDDADLVDEAIGRNMHAAADTIDTLRAALDYWPVAKERDEARAEVARLREERRQDADAFAAEVARLRDDYGRISRALDQRNIEVARLTEENERRRAWSVEETRFRRDLDEARAEVARLTDENDALETRARRDMDEWTALESEVARLREIVLHVISTPHHSVASCPPLTRAMCPYAADIAALGEGTGAAGGRSPFPMPKLTSGYPVDADEAAALRRIVDRDIIDRGDP